MEKIKQAFLRFWSSPRCVFWLGLIVTLAATLSEVSRGRQANFFVYSDATRMFWEGANPYTMEFVEAHGRFFLYLPPFFLLFAPLAYLPPLVGPFAWNLLNYGLLALSIRTLPPRLAPYRHWIFLFLLPVVLQSVFCFQFNMVVCYLFLFAYNLLERGHGFWAVALIMLSATTKIYGGIELALLFLYPRVWRNMGYAALWGVALLLAPGLNPNIASLQETYINMFNILSTHNQESIFTSIFFARGLYPFLLSYMRWVQIGVLLAMAVAFFASWRKWGLPLFRARCLALLMGYIILFSDCSEIHTYLIALAGWAVAFWMKDERTRVDWALLWLLVFAFGIIPTDVLCPKAVFVWLSDHLSLSIYAFTLAWGRTLYLTFATDNKTRD